MNEDRLPVASLRNLGPKSALILAQAGIRTIAELRLLGAAKAYKRAKAFAPRSVSLSLPLTTVRTAIPCSEKNGSAWCCNASIAGPIRVIVDRMANAYEEKLSTAACA